MMKKVFLTTVIAVIALFFSSCSHNSVSPVGEKPGKISLTFDKTTMPAGIVNVKAQLSRENYTTIEQNMNVLNDTSASLTINNLNSGVWHLKVDASDSAGIVLYSGESDVSISAGFTTQVDLTLNPTGAGYGNIEIKVKWGTTVVSPSQWTDYELNPVLTGNSGTESRGCSFSRILFENGIYKIYYTGVNNGGRGYLRYAYSNDGIQWTKLNSPILSPGYGWDSGSLGMGGIIKVDGQYRLYYTAFASQSGSWSIGLATSTDGINFTKKTDPIYTGTSTWEYQVMAGDIIVVNGTYFLYYVAKSYNGSSFKIGLVTSTDGINFSNPSIVLSNTLSWEGQVGLQSPSVIFENNKFKMVYTDYEGRYIGSAESLDGYNWTKANNYFFSYSQSSNNWTYKFLGINYRKNNNEYRIYYTNEIGGDHFIGFLRKAQ